MDKDVTQKYPVLILGAGRGGLALLEMFLDEKVVNIIGVADCDQNAPGIKLAIAHGIATYSNPFEAIQLSLSVPECIVYNLTHDDSLAEEAKKLFGNIKVTDGTEAGLLWRMVTNMKSAKDQLEAANIQLLQSEKMASIGQLAAGIAHEINNPIGYVYSNLNSLDKYVQRTFELLDLYELAEDGISDPDERLKLKVARENVDIDYLKSDLHSLMAESKDGITRVKNIIQNLKDFSHLDTSDTWVYSDLHQGLESTLNIVNHEIKYKAELIKQYGVIPEVECLPSQINQVFLNILINAAHAIEGKGKITISTGTDAAGVWVDISDTGHGIPPENLKKIFNPFFTTKPVGKGTGLGLSLSYSIVQKHNGKIDVISEVGKGSTFRMWLPIIHSAMNEKIR
jgi:signal transduction histidine kinase